MEPHWLTIDEIPYEHMWDGDRQWLPMLLEGKKLKGPIVFGRDNSTVDKMDLTTVDTPFLKANTWRALICILMDNLYLIGCNIYAICL